jgi:hydrogenase maturation protease
MSDAGGTVSPRVICIGVGIPFRRDDGAGIAVLNRLKERQIPGLHLLESSGEGATLITLWAGGDHVFIVDAACSDGIPGSIYRIDARQQALQPDFFYYSTHAFSVAEAVELARALDQLPPHLIIYGIEGADFGMGAELSAPVQAAADQVADRIAEAAQRLLGRQQ